MTWRVGLDGSDGAASALRWANAVAEGRGERVAPVAAWHLPFPITALAGRRPIDVDRAGLKAEVEFHALEAIAALDDAEHVDSPQIIEGHPGDVLCELADADTPVVVGRRGAGGLRHRVLGSVSQHVATHADGPVVVVPEDWSARPLRKVVVGFDGSDHAGDALRWALSVAPSDAEVELLIAIDVIPWLSPELVVDRHPDEYEAAHERLGAAADAVDPEGRATRHFVAHGPRQALGDASGDADLVVVGPRGIGGFARAILGSVTTWLLHDAPCPVAVVQSK